MKMQIASEQTDEANGEGKITKTIRLTKRLDIALKDEAHRRTMERGKRVTESALIEQALLNFLNIQAFKNKEGG